MAEMNHLPQNLPLSKFNSATQVLRVVEVMARLLISAHSDVFCGKNIAGNVTLLTLFYTTTVAGKAFSDDFPVLLRIQKETVPPNRYFLGVP